MAPFHRVLGPGMLHVAQILWGIVWASHLLRVRGRMVRAPCGQDLGSVHRVFDVTVMFRGYRFRGPIGFHRVFR